MTKAETPGRSTEDPIKKYRLNGLDGLRGLAAIIVVIGHLEGYFIERTFGIKQTFFSGGWISVDLFFIISGMVLSYVYYSKIMEKKCSLTLFFIHRVARLYPVYLLTFFIVICEQVFFHNILHQSNIPCFPKEFGTYIPIFLSMMQTLDIYGFSTGASGINPPAWSLSAEFMVNFLFVILLVKKKTNWIIPICIFATVGMINRGFFHIMDLWSDGSFIFNIQFLKACSGFFIGVLIERAVFSNASLAPLFNAHQPSWSSSINIAPVGFKLELVVINLVTSACFISLLLYMADPENKCYTAYLVASQTIICPIVVLGVEMKSTLIYNILRWDLFQFFGDLSYSIYMLHMPLLFCFICGNKVRSLHAIPLALQCSIFFVLLIFYSWLSFKYFERPLRKWIVERYALFAG